MALWNLAKKKILIVDDFPEMRSLLRSMVTAYGATDIEQAVNGEEAVRVMASGRFDIVLCDYNLGDGKDGQQVLEEAKYRGLLPGSTCFVMVTAESTSQMVMGALEYQPDGYISKPVTKVVLQARLKKLLEKKDSFREISKLLDRKQYDKVAELCDRYIENGSKYRTELLKIKSDVLIKTGAYDRAMELCTGVVAERELAWAMFDIGRVRYHRQQYRQAVESFSAIIAHNSAYVAAYDWLARAQERLGDSVSAQTTLVEAIGRSSKSLLRLRALADVAEKNEDYEVTETARRKAIRVGKASVLRQPADYRKLAKTLVRNNSAKDALKVVESIRYEFRDDPQAELEAATVHSHIYSALGNDKASGEMLEKAVELAAGNPGLVSADVGIDLAQACLAHGRKAEANDFIRSVVKNHHDNEDILGRITRLYGEVGERQEVEALIENTRSEIVKINNDGVKLLKDGKVQESIELFTRAARGMPQNPIINLNAAQSLIRKMKQSRPTSDSLDEALSYIRAAGNSDAHQERQSRLLAECRELSACL